MPVSFGLLFTEMPMTWSHGVTLVNVKAKSRNVMKCFKIQFKFARSLTYGASISGTVPVLTREQDCPDFEDSRARGFVHRSLDLLSFACSFIGIR
ncbi:hypothetical protein Tco_0515152, partial [Tanacetum coccineum]